VDVSAWRFAMAVVIVTAALTAALRAVGRRGVGRGDFQVRLGPGERVEVTGRLPRSKVAEIRAFFREQPGGVPHGRIVGSFTPAGAPRLHFEGRFPPEVQQRARNFLIEHLR